MTSVLVGSLLGLGSLLAPTGGPIAVVDAAGGDAPLPVPQIGGAVLPLAVKAGFAVHTRPEFGSTVHPETDTRGEVV